MYVFLRTHAHVRVCVCVCVCVRARVRVSVSMCRLAEPPAGEWPPKSYTCYTCLHVRQAERSQDSPRTTFPPPPPPPPSPTSAPPPPTTPLPPHPVSSRSCSSPAPSRARELMPAPRMGPVKTVGCDCRVGGNQWCISALQCSPR